MKNKRCHICGQIEGEFSEGRQVTLRPTGVCDACVDHMERLKDLYRADFELRHGNVEEVIPFPAFRGATGQMSTPGFNWPPYDQVFVASSYMNGCAEFAAALAEDALIAGRRSAYSRLAELRSRRQEIVRELHNGHGAHQREILEEQRRKVEVAIGNMENRMTPNPALDINANRPMDLRTRPLNIVPYDVMSRPKVKDKGDWLEVRVPYRYVKNNFFDRKRWKRGEIWWTISKEFEPAVDRLDHRTKEVNE